MLKDMLKKIDVLDISLIKLAIIAFVFGVIAMFPVVAGWVLTTNPWYFIAAFVILIIRPLYKIWFRK